MENLNEFPLMKSIVANKNREMKISLPVEQGDEKYPMLAKAVKLGSLSKSLEFDKKGSEIKDGISAKIGECQGKLAVLELEYKASLVAKPDDIGPTDITMNRAGGYTKTETVPEEPWAIRRLRDKIEDLRRMKRNIVDSKKYKLSEYDLERFGM